MKIAFGDPLELDYTPDTPYRAPLGGSQSAACYLAQALAAGGHEIHYACHTTSPGTYHGVRCVSWKDFGFEKMKALSLDAFVILLGPGPEQRLRSELAPQTRLVLWTGHADDQPGIATLGDPAVHDSYDGIACVSEWQKARFLKRFALDPQRTAVLRNAMAPAFEGLFAGDEAILPAKAVPPVLAYTSTPFRGLDLLLSIFPRVRARVPGTRLRVYSSMSLYGYSRAEDESQFGALYRELARMEGAELVGALPQPALAPRLREAAVLAYPNTFAETSCISLMEAMASGCRIVTSRLGALPETAADHATLIPVDDERAYVGRFVDATVAALNEIAGGSCSGNLRTQVDFACSHYGWTGRAREWAEWLDALPARRRRQ